MAFHPTVRLLPLIAALAAVPGGSALAGGAYDLTVFTAADLDLSGSLSAAEFTTTLDPNLSPKARAKSFRRADLNRDRLVQVNEFLLFTHVIEPKNALEKWFYRADVSIDGELDFGEFTAGFGGKSSLVSIRRDFLRADVDASGAVTLEEYVRFRRGQVAPNLFTVFQLADFNGDGRVSVTEFGYIYSQNTAQAVILERFVKLDDNGDGVLTTAEWNPGVH